ncbi:unnamed protein product, partial [marine sediment metagenome]
MASTARKATRRIYAGIGEVLWDVFGRKKTLGGAPANFACHAHALGNDGRVLSRVGDDALGEAIRSRLADSGLDVRTLQTDRQRPTGTVKVAVAADGQPTFTIAKNSAWDALRRTKTWQQLAPQCSAVCFGTLAQRSEPSRNTIRSFLRQAAPQALIVFDINLRQHYYSPPIIERSLLHSHVLKINDEEVAVVKEMAGHATLTDVDWARKLIDCFNLKLVCITRGKDGSALIGPRGFAEHPGYRVTVADTVGAGDAFTAAMVHATLRNKPLTFIAEFANRI